MNGQGKHAATPGKPEQTNETRMSRTPARPQQGSTPAPVQQQDQGSPSPSQQSGQTTPVIRDWASI